MTSPELSVKITADLQDIKQGLGLLRGEIAKTKTSASDFGKEFRAGLDSFKRVAVAYTGALLGVGAVSAGLQAVVRNTVEAEKAQSQLRAALASSKGAIGLTADELNRHAEALQKVSTFDDDAITGAQTLLLQFDNIGRNTFPRATQAVLDFAARMGVDLTSAAQTVGKALQDPENGLKGLRAAGVNLTDQQKDLIVSLVETGRVAEAQAIVLDDLERAVGGAAKANRDTLAGALEAAQKAFGNLLEGDTGSEGLRGMLKGINDLTDTLNSDEVKRGFQSIIQGMANVASYAANAIAQANNFRIAIGDALSIDADKSIPGLLTRQRQLQEDLLAVKQGKLSALWAAYFGRGVGDVGENNINLLESTKENQDRIERELRAVTAQINARNGLFMGRRVPGLGSAASGARPDLFPLDGQIIIHGADSPDWNTADKLAAAAAKAKAEALREAAKASKEYQDALESVDKVLRATSEEMGGPALQAANEYKDTMLALAEAEATLAKQGKLDEEQQNRLALAREQAAAAYQKQLAAIEEAKRKELFGALQNQAQAISSNLQSTSTSISTQADAGLLPQTEAEEKLQAVRQKSIDQLRALRLATIAYLQTMAPEDPNAQKALELLNEIDAQIAEVDRSMHQFREQAKDQAVDSLTNFLTDLATGAKSFKEAFRDMVLSFIQGLARMAAEALAKQAVLALVNYVGSLFSGGTTVTASGASGISGTVAGFHQGGIIGGAPTFRRKISIPPLLRGEPLRYHSGGIIGSREQLIIGQIGEEVLRRDDPRHILNRGQAAGRGREAPAQVYVVFSEDELANAMAGRAGERVTIAHVQNNRRHLDAGTGGG